MTPKAKNKILLLCLYIAEENISFPGKQKNPCTFVRLVITWSISLQLLLKNIAGLPQKWIRSKDILFSDSEMICSLLISVSSALNTSLLIFFPPLLSIFKLSCNFQGRTHFMNLSALNLIPVKTHFHHLAISAFWDGLLLQTGPTPSQPPVILQAFSREPKADSLLVKALFLPNKGQTGNRSVRWNTED